MQETQNEAQASEHRARFAEQERPPERAVLIVNGKARRGREAFQQAQDCLRADGVTLEAAHALKDPKRLPDLLRESVAQGAKLIVVGGGDGSLRTAAEVLANQDVTLGALPLGTVNDFARNLGITPTVEAACKVISEGCAARIDLGQANDRYFIITASFGFSAMAQHVLTPRQKRLLGPLGYVAASALALRRLRSLPITVRSEQGEERLTVTQAGVINGHSWMGGAFEIPGVDVESGRLAFYAVPPMGKLALLRMVYNLRSGRFFDTPGLRAFTTRDVMVGTERSHPLVLDGDLYGETPVRFRVAPEALKVCVPAAAVG
jgi:YegS/Rv2252/BmrU family lipid kinase